MTTGQKTAVSLLISTILFAAFAVFAYTGLFSVLDARFYEPAKIEQIQNHLDLISNNYDEYLETLENRFGKNEQSFLKQKSVSSFAENIPSDEDVLARSKLSGDLFSQTPGLLGMRLIDKNGVNIHFSTFSTDILSRTDKIVSYKNYSDSITAAGQKELLFENISSKDSYATKGNDCKTIFDGLNNRIIFSFPFYDKYSAFRGSFIFYVDANDFNRVLLSKKIITFGDSGILISDLKNEEAQIENYKNGFVFGIPRVGKNIFEKEILNHWNKGLLNPEKIVASENNLESDQVKTENHFSIFDFEKTKTEKYWVLISSSNSQKSFVGGIYSDEIFALPDNVKTLLLVCIFLTLFLVIFLIFNLRQDEMLVIRDRIKRFQLGIISEYLKQKEDVDWSVISGKIALRQQDFTLEIFKSLGSKGKKHSKEISELINRSFEDLLSAMNAQSEKAKSENALSNSEEIKKMLSELLSSGSIKVQTVNSQEKNQLPQNAKTANENSAELFGLDSVKNVEDVEEAEALEDLEELDSTEAVEELDEVEELEELDDIEEIAELDEVENVEPLNDGAQNNFDEVDALESVEELEEINSFEEIHDAEEVLENENIVEENLIDKTTLNEKENVETPEQLEKVESLETDLTNENLNVENISKIEDISNFEEITNIEDIEEFDEIKDNKEKDSLPEKTEIKKEIVTNLDDIQFEEVSDFFADDVLGEDENQPALEAELESSQDVEKLNIETSKKKLHSFDEEDNFIFENFSTQGLDYSSLDKKIEQEENFEQNEQKENVHKEQIQFDEKSDKNTQKVEDAPKEQNVDTEDAEELISSEQQPFSFTSFGMYSSDIEDLTLAEDIIQQDEKGVFEIHSDGFEKEPEDINFKNLVDAVLRK